MKTTQPRLNATLILLLTALCVGTVDIIFALVYWASVGASVPGVFQSIAAGIMGKASRSAGMTSVILGAACHYFITCCMAFAYFFVAKKVVFLFRHPIWFGALYGLFLYAFMNFVVLPLSAVGMPTFANRSWVLSSIVMHGLFGVMFALGARLAASKNLATRQV